MTVTKNLERQPIPIEAADPAVEAALGTREDVYARITKARTMTPAQRRKARKDRQRNRVMLDLAPDLELVLEMLAAEYSIPKSQAAAYLMIAGLNSVSEGRVNLGLARRFSRSMRYEYVLNLPEIPAEIRQRVERFRAEQKRRENGGA